MNIGIPVTKAQHDNLLLAKQLWNERVMPKAVDLETWVCGTQACFGGHLMQWPEFQALGVGIDERGMPCMSTAYAPVAGFEVANKLFGINALFCERGRFQIEVIDQFDDLDDFNEDALCDAENADCCEDGDETLDHEVVNRRIDWVLANTMVKHDSL